MTPAALTFQTPPRWRAGDIAAALAARTGTADAARIDSNVLRLQWEALAELRILETLGPFPIQPIVVSRDMPESQRDEIAAALREDLGDALLPFGFLGVGPVTPQDYARECRAVRLLEPSEHP